MVHGRTFADEPMRERQRYVVNGSGVLVLPTQNDRTREPDTLHSRWRSRNPRPAGLFFAVVVVVVLHFGLRHCSSLSKCRARGRLTAPPTRRLIGTHAAPER